MRKNEDQTELIGAIQGPNNTPYEGGIFYFSIRLARNNTLLEFTFLTKIIHPNIMKNGRFRVQIQYQTMRDLKDLLDWVVNLLKEPQWNQSKLSNNSKLHLKDPEAYNTYVKLATIKYAN